MGIKIEDKNGTELTQAVADETGIDFDVVKSVFKGLRKVIITCVKDDVKSYISRFISFAPKTIKGRSGTINGTPYTSVDKLSVKVKLSNTVVTDLN